MSSFTRVIFLCLPCFLATFCLLGPIHAADVDGRHNGPTTRPQAATRPQPDAARDSAWAAAIREEENQALREQRLLPSIKEGKPVASSVRSAAVLEFIVNDYRTRVAARTLGLTYSISAGVGRKATDCAHRVGAFRKKDGPVATYFIALGDGFGATQNLLIQIADHEPDGIRDSYAIVKWDAEGQKWTVAESTDADPSGAALEISEIPIEKHE